MRVPRRWPGTWGNRGSGDGCQRSSQGVMGRAFEPPGSEEGVAWQRTSEEAPCSFMVVTLTSLRGGGGGFCSCDNHWAKERWDNPSSEDPDDTLGPLGSPLL